MRDKPGVASVEFLEPPGLELGPAEAIDQARRLLCGGGGCSCPDDGNQCTDDLCVNGVCTHPALSGPPCDDLWFCTINDTCVQGTCLGTLRDCDDGNPCTRDYCGTVPSDPPYQACLSSPMIAPCSDGDPCTVNDRCLSGLCGGQPMDCDDGNPCTDDACVAGGCTHSPESGAACSDRDPCTLNDGRIAGICVGTPGQDCDDGNPCTDDNCIAGGRCDHPFINNVPCDDRDACPENDTCSQGVCQPGPLVDCDDQNPCTIEAGCNPATGCIHNDVNCDDGDPCTNDWCDPSTGLCEHGPFDPESFTEGCEGCVVNLGLPLWIPVNNDDDNNNGVPDWEDTGPVANEDDLVGISANVTECDPADVGCNSSDVSWHLCELGGNRHYTLYLSSSKEGPVNHSSESPWPPPATIYMEGFSAWVCPAPVYFWLNYGACCWDTGTDVDVVGVTSLDWEVPAGAPENPALDDCPNNGGVRIFPGKTAPDDPSPADRRTVDLVATIEPPIPGVTVYFKVWDVDDPFDQLHGPDGLNDVPNVGVIDNDTGGPDNRGVGQGDPGVGQRTATTNAFGVA